MQVKAAREDVVGGSSVQEWLRPLRNPREILTNVI
jgi:hypothetical protein